MVSTTRPPTSQLLLQMLKGRFQLSRCNGAAGIDQPICRQIALLTVKQRAGPGRTHEGGFLRPRRLLATAQRLGLTTHTHSHSLTHSRRRACRLAATDWTRDASRDPAIDGCKCCVVSAVDGRRRPAYSSCPPVRQV